MKKRFIILGLLVALSFLLLNCTAIGEEISLPAGLKFGMSISEAHTVSGFAKGEPYEWLKQYISARGLPFGTEILQGKVTIGGVEATANVFFDKKGLTQVQYVFTQNAQAHGRDIISEIEPNYSYVETSLQEKYGEPLDLSTHVHTYMPPTLNTFYFRYSTTIFSSTFTENTFVTAIVPTRRLIQSSEDSSIYIDHYVELRQSEKGYMQSHHLTYTYYDFAVSTDPQTETSVGF